ncbi:hypothetical protein [Alteromonas lipolytica]|nr:hypothetical protein [Alteromonas lipolytica]GGF71427.1 hypothetical protein GCM10011338_24550 [Alteromonas lipolytica]
MKRLLLLTLLLIQPLMTEAKSDDHIMVIINKSSDIEQLSKSQVKNIFMGTVSVDNIVPLGLPPGEVARSIFNVRVIGLTESRIRSYWAQMRFSGRLKEPDNASGIDDLIINIRSASNTIGYVPENTPLPDDIKVVFRSSEQ